MNLLTHLIVKDLRAVRRPLAAWAGGLFLLTLDRATELTGRKLYDSPLSVFILIVLTGMAVALVAGIVQEDSLVTPTAFWRTRPIARVRLFLSKLATILLIFVPAFTPLLVASAGPDAFWLKQCLLAACVMMLVAVVAALSRHLLQFLLGLVFATGVYIGVLMLCMEVARKNRIYRDWWGVSQFDGALELTGVICAVALAYLYLGGQRKFGVILLTTAVVLGPILSLA